MDGFTLKIIALIAMFLDHAASSFPNMFPIWFGWIGRLAIPLFLFTMAEGIIHTRNIKKYLARIYIFSIIIGVGNFILNLIFGTESHGIADNFFTTIFVVAITISIIRYNGSKQTKMFLWGGYIGMQIIGTILTTLLPTFSSITNAIIPTILTCEGSVLFVVLGIILYFFSPSREGKNRKLHFIIAYMLYSIALLVLSASMGGFTMQNLFMENYLWLLIIALPFILLYNGAKGKSMKYLFYAFYPLHLWILFISEKLIK